MFEHKPEILTEEVLSITIEGEVIEVGETYQLFWNGEQYVGVVAEVSKDEEQHTVTIVLEDITTPESAKNRYGTFVYNTLQKTWTAA